MKTKMKTFFLLLLGLLFGVMLCQLKSFQGMQSLSICILLVVAGLALLLCGWIFFRRHAYRDAAIVKQLPLRYLVADREGQILHYSSDMKPFVRQKLTMSQLSSFQPPSLPQEMTDAFRRHFETGEKQYVNFEFQGSQRSAIVTSLPYNLFKTTTAFWISYDTSILQAERNAAATAAEQFRTILASIGDGVIATDEQERVTLINPAAEALTGYTAKEAAGRKLDEIFDIISYLNGQKVESPLHKALLTGEKMELANHTDLVAKDGSRSHIADSAAPVRNPKGEIQGGVLVFRDVTAEYEGRDQLRRAFTGLEYASELTQSAYFRLSMTDWQVVDSSKLFDQLWPVENGKTLAPEYVVYPDDLSEFQMNHDTLRQGETVSWNFRTFIHGKLRHMRLRASLDSSDRNLPCMIGVIQDVTEITKNATLFKEQMELWNAVVDALPVSIFVKDPENDYRYILSNRTMEKTIQCHRDKIIGHTDFELLPERLAKQSRSVDIDAMATTKSIEYVQILNTQKNKPRHMQMLKKMFISETGRRLLLGVASDITELTLSMEYQKVMNYSLNMLFQEEDAETSIRNVLQKLGAYTHATRVFIMKYDLPNNRKRKFAEYAQDGKDLMFVDNTDISYDPNDPWFQTLRRDEFVFIPQLDTPEAKQELAGFHELFINSGTRSLFGSGLLLDGHIWGDFALVYEDEDHHLSNWETMAFKNTKALIELLLQRLKTQNNLKEALLNQQVLNSSMETLFLENDFEHAIETLLQIVCEHFKATRCYILKFNFQNGNCRCFAEYVRQGGAPMFEKTAIFPMDPGEKWLNIFQEKQSILIYDLNNQEEASLLGTWESYIKQFNMRSVFIAPIYLHGELWGDFGAIYEDVPCWNFNQSELDMLNAAAHLIEVILERQETHDHLTEAVKQAQAADRAKSYFIASVSHEIRTPLNAVIGFAELLKNGNLTQAECDSYVEAISFSGNSLLQLINDILDLSKLEAAQMTLLLGPVDFHKLSSDVMKIFSYRANEKNLQLNLDIPNMPLLELDQMRIRQILINLVGNAIKFTQHGSITIQANYKENGDGSAFFQFDVVDTGIGIAKEDQEKLMRPFVQLSNLRGTNSGNNGTGLGLAISSRLLQAMGGEMTLSSESGRGSKFMATLPQVKISHCLQSTSTSEEQAESPVTLKQNATLLLVDDVQMNLKVLEAMCKKLGMRCVLASSAQEALAKIKTEQFDAVLTDMWMPETNGEQLAKIIRTELKLDTLPIIAVTADVEIKQDFRTDYFSAILRKPITLDKIREMLSLVMQPNKTNS